MYKSLAYKEWLKVRWFALVAFGLEVIALIYIFTNLRATIEFNSAFDIWNVIIFRNFMFFEPIKYIPVFVGLMVGLSQYLPEILDMKLKLTLHLPLKENYIFLFLNLFGTLLLLALFIPIILIIVVVSISIFPSEIVSATLLTILPWFLAAFVLYYFISAIMIEPLWIRRVIIAVVGFVFVMQFLFETGYGAYQHILLPLFIITLFFSVLHLLSGLRFKRGAK